MREFPHTVTHGIPHSVMTLTWSDTVQDTGGRRDTHGTHTGQKGAHGHTDHTDETVPPRKQYRTIVNEYTTPVVASVVLTFTQHVNGTTVNSNSGLST